MAFLLPRLTCASVPYVQDGTRSAHFELVKLLEGEIDGVFSVEGRPGFVVKASNRFWRFDAQGHLLEQTRRTNTEACGASFALIEPEDSSGSWRVYRSEWLLTGSDKRTELPLERLAPEDRPRLEELLGRSDLVIPLRAGSSRYPGFHGLALQSNGTWQGWDLSSWSDSLWYDLPVRTQEAQDRESGLWEVHELEGAQRLSPPRLNQAQLASLGPDSTPPLVATDFSRRSVEFADGFWLWIFWKTLGWWLLAGVPGQPPYAYWGGVGTFALLHEGEALRFRATASLGERDDGGVSAENLRLLELPGLRLLRVTGPGMEYSKFYTKQGLTEKAHDEVGLYLVRTPLKTPDQALAGSWVPEITGLTWGIWDYPSGMVDFVGGGVAQAFALAPESLSESFDELPRGGRVLPQPFRQIPSKLALRLPVNHGKYLAALAVDLGGKRWLFLPHDDGAKIEVSLDSTEYARTWGILGGGDLRLVADFEFHKERLLDEGTDDNEWVHPTLSLAKGRRKIRLAQVQWSAPDLELPLAGEERTRFLASRNWQVGKLVRAGRLAPQEWVELTRDLLHDPELLKERVIWIVYVANELLNASSSAKDERTSRLIVDFWIAELHPKVRNLDDPELTKASAVFSSNSLGNAIDWRDTVLCRRILDELVDKDQEKIEHGTLHYNLACYYAWRKDKPALLAAVRRARLRGEPVSQFRHEPDFLPWLSDADFVKVLDAEH